MNQADTAWMLVSTALVLLMTPALAFFYGGLVRPKNALNTMMMSFVALGVVAMSWAVLGYSLAFAPGNAWVGDTSRPFLRGVVLDPVPPFTLLGAGVLWFGWFGFNAGSAVAANGIAALAFTATLLAPAATLTVWMLIDIARSRNPTAVGAATAIVVGLVAVTPAAGFIGPMSAIALGAIAAVPSYFGLLYRAKTSLDDSLDVVAAHGVGGTVGALLTGVFAQKALNGVADGALFGNPWQLVIQLTAVTAAIVYSGGLSFVLLKLVGAFIPLRADREQETL